MKKISTLALALIAMGSLALPVSAQETFTPVSSIDASGWYQMRQVVGKNNTAITTDAPVYVYSQGSVFTSGSFSTWFGTASTQKEDATAFVYVDKGTSNFAIQNINGKYGNATAAQSDSRFGINITAKNTTNNTFTVGTYWDDWASFNGHMGGSYQNSTAEFQFSKVSDTELAKYDVYTVTINGVSNGSVTSTNSANKGTQVVYSGGHYFFTAGTSLTESDFTAADVAGTTKTITVNTSSKTVTVTYALNESDLTALIEDAKKILAQKGIGCPTESAASRTTLNTAITTAEGNKTLANYNTLSSALETYINSTADIVMPEDGKAYTITMVSKAGAKYYMDYAESGYSLKATEATDNSSYPITATLICHKLENGSYVFLNNAGKYLTFKGNGTASEYNSNKGYLDSYETAEFTTTSGETTTKTTLYPAQVSISKLTKASYAETPKGMYVYASTNRYKTKADAGVFVLSTADKSYNAASVPFYNDNYSSALLIEEVSYPNTVTFNDATGIEGVSKIATFSAPFATIKPTDVKAYYVGNTSGDKATMTEINGNIPANTGVILTSESGDAVTMVPVAGEEVATVENNKLGNTAGAEKTFNAGEGFVLGSADGTVAFYKAKANTTLSMNKAYLTNGTVGNALKLDFGTATGINNAAIADAAAENAPVYDLTGRRVAKTVKGNLYIKGGKKYIAQ